MNNNMQDHLDKAAKEPNPDNVYELIDELRKKIAVCERWVLYLKDRNEKLEQAMKDTIEIQQTIKENMEEILKKTFKKYINKFIDMHNENTFFKKIPKFGEKKKEEDE